VTPPLGCSIHPLTPLSLMPQRSLQLAGVQLCPRVSSQHTDYSMAVHRPQPASGRVWKAVLKAMVELRTLSRHSSLKSLRAPLDVNAGVHSGADSCAIPGERQVWNRLAQINKSQRRAQAAPSGAPDTSQRSWSWTCSTTSGGDNSTQTLRLPHRAAVLCLPATVPALWANWAITTMPWSAAELPSP